MSKDDIYYITTLETGIRIAAPTDKFMAYLESYLSRGYTYVPGSANLSGTLKRASLDQPATASGAEEIELPIVSDKPETPSQGGVDHSNPLGLEKPDPKEPSDPEILEDKQSEADNVHPTAPDAPEVPTAVDPTPPVQIVVPDVKEDAPGKPGTTKPKTKSATKPKGKKNSRQKAAAAKTGTSEEK